MSEVAKFELDDITEAVPLMMEQANFLISEGLVPPVEGRAAKPSEVVMMISKGAKLGMDPITSINSIDIISGNTAIRTNVISGLLAKKGIAIRVVRDFDPEKEIAYIRDKEGNPLIDDNDKLRYYIDHDGSPKYGKPKNWVTEIEVIRDFG
jgi:hypothetical protein